FEEADGGTIFLDEVGELPLTTQVRLLRVLENGEFLKVGSSAVQKTNVRIVAATNLNMPKAIQQGKFREDLFYRLSTVEIVLPPLRERDGDIHLLFRKFAADFAQKYKMPTVRLDEQAQQLLERQQWHGNIRQLRNVAEQLSVLEQDRAIGVDTLSLYLPNHDMRLPAVVSSSSDQGSDFSSEREILYKVLFDMKSDLNDLKQLTLELMNSSNTDQVRTENEGLIQKIYGNEQDQTERLLPSANEPKPYTSKTEDKFEYAEEIEEEETLSLIEKELELIKKALERNHGKRKAAANELGISERTLYRKIKQFDLDL
ncbi:MAG: sigma 54-interacting transcriptional regulator, partial [Flavobacteriaceae bacterium]